MAIRLTTIALWLAAAAYAAGTFWPEPPADGSRIALPGRAVIDLEAGEYNVWTAPGRSANSKCSPSDLFADLRGDGVSLRRRGGPALPLQRNTSCGGRGGSHVSGGHFAVPEAGRYTLTATRSVPAAERRSLVNTSVHLAPRSNFLREVAILVAIVLIAVGLTIALVRRYSRNF